MLPLPSPPLQLIQVPIAQPSAQPHLQSTLHTSLCCEDRPRQCSGVEQSGHPLGAPIMASMVALLITLWPAPSPASPTEQQPPASRSSSSGSATVEAPMPGTSPAAPSVAATSTADAPPTTFYAPVPAEKYVPSPVEPGWEVYAGFLAGIIPFAIGSWEFGKRIIIQRRCALCSGRGLVPSSRTGTKYLRKCPECGGFFPWISWKMFLTSTAAPGNGGPLQQPKGQTSVLYSVPENPTPEDVARVQTRYMSASSEQEQKQEEKQ
ncbi:hypothetical protein DUNSADRAFT_3088 [Dunaliella salina]|uniref:Encoded protein n=1 Tax=Dunaliella salina TaxID=3046 RepID=A0ABQ7GUJ3_DUNSA|nr:hypothetical protein DUNSADRAFT_3088 [Dunaliella salina]|eukprot:KAF5838292.1 hypothetical protein DUNSADRAFT_3088 [Dunaliella salina]